MFDDFYGLTGRPFQLTPDPAFYFESRTHQKALSYLGYGLSQAEGFIVITGEVGAGKSTLVAHLMATIDPARLTAAQVVTSNLDGEEIVHVVAQAFGLPVEGHDKASALGAIEAFLHDEARAGRRCLLVVDEAQNLAIEALEELRMLSNFQLGAHPLLQTLLLGQPEFRDSLRAHPGLEQLRQRVIATHHLEAMEESEVRQYVEHRLRHVGWTGRPSFDAAIFAEIHRASGGIPRRVNQLLSRLLLLGAVDRRETIDLDMLRHVQSELTGDGTIAGPPVSPPAGEQQSMNAHAAGEQAAATASPAIAASTGAPQIAAALAERDAQIAELQQAVIELANAVEGPLVTASRATAQDVAALQQRMAALEGRHAELEQTVRHTLTMLIEWIESDDLHRAAA